MLEIIIRLNRIDLKFTIQEGPSQNGLENPRRLVHMGFKFGSLVNNLHSTKKLVIH